MTRLLSDPSSGDKDFGAVSIEDPGDATDGDIDNDPKRPSFRGGRLARGGISGSDDVSSPVPSSGPTTVSGFVPPEFFGYCLGSEGTFKESVSKSIPSF
ncbi:hypothetical protein HAX54_040492 [Datura stramonium]|uniref:Uncharacterized protein n=1 Tax=Datura stramonium TaxID=4076 RepID=A0ABS8VQ86_DATST|nr:hypothetical protein [Datura stramonium]